METGPQEGSYEDYGFVAPGNPTVEEYIEDTTYAAS